MVTADTVFNLAMALMDELSEIDGLYDIAETRVYKNRTLHLINILANECAALSRERISFPLPMLVSFSEAVPLDEALCTGVLPYGLAAHLLLDENPSLAAYFNARYDELLRLYIRTSKTDSESIENVYGSIEFGQFSSWS